MVQDLTSLSPNELLQRAVSGFEAQQFVQSWDALEEIMRRSLTGPGLRHLRACCAIALERWHEVASDLALELTTTPNHIESKTLTDQINAIIATNPTLANAPSTLPTGRYIISGISQDSSGTGRFLQTLIPKAQARGFSIIHAAAYCIVPGEKVRIGTLRNSDIIVLHPQSMGWDLIRSLHEAGNRITFFVLDNSFFCIRSYNNRPGKEGDCLDCLGNLEACHAQCVPFPITPVYNEREKARAHLAWLQKNSDNITFLCQSTSQESLVREHFGPNTQTIVVGMLPSDLVDDTPTASKRFDLVFHGELLAAKGINYFCALAALLPEFKILIPGALEDVLRVTNLSSLPAHITCTNMRWNTGLREEILAARLVVCPSQWSSAVEGALLKSLYLNGNVAIYRTERGFPTELPESVVLGLTADITSSSQRIRDFLNKQLTNRDAARKFVQNYAAQVQLDRVFA